jgi:hypothetical protein
MACTTHTDPNRDVAISCTPGEYKPKPRRKITDRVAVVEG